MNYSVLFGDDVEQEVYTHAVHIGHQHAAEVQNGSFWINQFANTAVPVLPFA